MFYTLYRVSLAADDRRVLLNTAGLKAFDCLTKFLAASFESSASQLEC